MSDVRAMRVVVAGRVQGVGYRYAARDQAERLGLTGWVRNLPTGRVEVLAQGPGDIVDRFIAWLEQGPRLASVTHLEVVPVQPDAELSTFSIRF